MTRMIWKFDLGDASSVSIQMPGKVKRRHVAMQRGSLCLWSEVTPSAKSVAHVFVVVGTGQPTPESAEYVGTAITEKGDYVWHVYEIV